VVRVACKDDLAEALAFWRSCGFRELRRIPGGKSRGRELVLMEAPALGVVQPELFPGFSAAIVGPCSRRDFACGVSYPAYRRDSQS
jgi:hypothetical protein